MSKNEIVLKRVHSWLNKSEIFCILFWAAQLLESSAYYIPYLLISILAVICYINNNKSHNSKINNVYKRDKGKYLVIIFSLLFSLIITLANYDLYYLGKPNDNVIRYILIFSLFSISGYIVFANIFNALLISLSTFIWEEEKNRFTPQRIYIISFFIIAVFNISILFLCQYPGNLTLDSIIQISQTISGNYSNHHPFYHTLFIKFCLSIGIALFGNINAGVAIYSVFQCLFMAVCFSFTLSTMAHIKVPIKIQLITLIFYVFMPYHIMFSTTMWKDVMFSGFVLLLITFIFRCIENLGNLLLNQIILFLSGIGTCLFRSNGFFVFILTSICIFWILKFTNKKMIYTFISVFLLSAILKYPVLNYLNITQPDMAEALSIPIQQVSRVIVEKKPLLNSEKILLNKVVNIEEIPQNYKPFISDNIKRMIRQKGNQDILVKNKFEYLKLYLKLGIKYPFSYIRAWIDQTKGYWNAGYEYWRWLHYVFRNKFGIKVSPLSEKYRQLLAKYLKMFTKIEILRIFLSIGFFVWVNLIILFTSIYRKDNIGILVNIPIIAIVLSLLIAAPVFSEFRYAYAVFCALPIIMTIALRPILKSVKKEN